MLQYNKTEYNIVSTRAIAWLNQVKYTIGVILTCDDQVRFGNITALCIFPCVRKTSDATAIVKNLRIHKSL